MRMAFCFNTAVTSQNPQNLLISATLAAMAGSGDNLMLFENGPQQIPVSTPSNLRSSQQKTLVYLDTSCCLE